MLLYLLPKVLVHCLQNGLLRNSGHLLELVGKHADIIDVDGLLSEDLDFNVFVLFVVLLGQLLNSVFSVLKTRGVPPTFEIPANHFAREHIQDVPGLIKLHVRNALALGEHIDELWDEFPESVQHFVRVLHIF